jgi:fluoroacetyl-CoA thioesterase
MGLEPGATNTLTIVVDESMTADRFGNTGVHVLATPMLVSYFELAAHQLAMPALAPGQGTVGSHIDIRHLAATPIGMRVTLPGDPHRARWASTAVPGRGRRRLRAGR